MFWYQITDSFGGPNLQLDTHSVPAIVPYSDPSNGLQLGNQDVINLSDAQTHGGFVMDSVLNFVYCRKLGNYSEVVLNRLDLRNNGLQRHGLGDTILLQDFSFPSIAFMGADSTDADNLVLCFHKTSSAIFPELHAIHFDDNAFNGSSTLVRAGDGPIDFYQGNQTERMGDYTTIQRRYVAAHPRCWLVGGYPNGASPNSFGRSFLFNAFIAEVGDSMGLFANGPIADDIHRYAIYPNPAIYDVAITSFDPRAVLKSVSLMDVQGREVPVEVEVGGNCAKISWQSIECGLYFARIQGNGNQES